MAKFLQGNELNLEIEKLFDCAEEQIILISPYIRLHERYASVLKTKIARDKVKIILVFGKNEEDLSKSMKEVDFNFFKEFPNIEIRYEKRLHAKYYSNENSAILTSMNLYNYSQDHNIEAGVMTKSSILGKLWEGEEGLDTQALKYFNRVIEQSELLFEKTPEYKKGLMGLTQTYINSVIKTDKLTEFFGGKLKTGPKTETNLEIKSNNSIGIEKGFGFCIRTGVKIPFDHKMPFCKKSFLEWNWYKNKDYKEKYCHFSGEESSGETTYAMPILSKNWKKAMEFHDYL
ncbi:MAG TPA: phospholipase D family protein [Flavobacteriales bacterium]|nr:phospholipase D family protein [Flavobacteriales bacterium]